ncbi:hypothetical protein [Bacillus thuringiensis]|uniref:hypothetical protein n=1 Tax=Bacillus thuringiensis TaxID=1428 RepID=UPI0036708A44
MMINLKEVLLIILGLYLAFSLGSFLKLIQFGMNSIFTILLSIITPIMLIKITIKNLFITIYEEGFFRGADYIKVSLTSYPLYVKLIGEIYAEFYAKQVAKRRVMKKYGLTVRGNTNSFSKLNSNVSDFIDFVIKIPKKTTFEISTKIYDDARNHKLS